ncbi:MAG: glycoside hydrolase [Verrucomicrobia bacterium]|nr:glycoside hydrolase [Verrucomicrobiota bacterium]
MLTSWSVGVLPAADTVSLAGEWRYALDRKDTGERERWFARDLEGKLTLPGSLPAQGIGDPVTPATKWIGGIIDKSWFTAPEYARYRAEGNVKVPFWLQPETTYAGAAWYQRAVVIPEAWAGRPIVLRLERPHGETRAWVGGRFLGWCNSLATAHEFELGALPPGELRLTVRVDNRMTIDVGENAHSVSDHTQGNWNGIVGRMELVARQKAWVGELSVHPQAATGSVRVTGRVAGGPLPPRVRLRVTAGEGAGELAAVDAAVDPASGAFSAMLALGQQAARWDEFAPRLHRLRAEIEGGEAGATTFGLRTIATEGTRFQINGRNLFFRGTLDCANYPRTGHPPMTVPEWKRIIGIAKAHGLNLIRFHSWCPPEAAFVAADEMGFYLHVEASTWPNHTTTLGDGKPIDAWLYEETERILRAYGNHPSFVLMAAGNEPGGRNHGAYLGKWVTHFRARDDRRLYTSAAGWPEIPENAWHCTPKPRIHAWGDGLKSRINARPPETQTDYRDFIAKRTVPVVSHEIGQWCAYPNFEEIAKYSGYLKARNFEIFRETLESHGMADLAKPFLIASGRLQTLCYKEDIESALRTPGMGGFELLDLHDFPGQGTALVGVLDAFWEPKGYVTAAEYRRFCGPTVPLARLAKRVFRRDERIEAAIEVAHFGAAPLEQAVAEWRLVADDGRIVAQGRLPERLIPVDNGVKLGEVSVPLEGLPAPARYRLAVGIAGTAAANDWDVWVYPEAVDTAVPAGLRVTREFDGPTRAALAQGERVVWLVPPGRVRNDPERKVVLGFSSIFWNTAWTKRQPPTTLGILCDPAHRALAGFPTDFHSNWQWWYLTSRAGVLILDDLPAGVRPVVQVIDDWFTARKLGLVIEARVGPGRLLVCSIDLDEGGANNPVAAQLRHSLWRYVASPEFAPTTEVSADVVARLAVP